jgi:DNA polymerase III delta prime subunit
LRAIAAVSGGHSLVLEGPPGTGKSQTITNLIAQALSEGKSVLFVAEKMAALEVVHNRLVSAGLGEFCLELHASKANKRAVMGELRASIDASLQVPNTSSTTARLPTVRANISDYARAVHFPGGALQFSPYTAVGLLDQVLEAPRFLFGADALSLTRDEMATVERTLDELAVAAREIGEPRAHPWRETRRTFYTPRALEELGESLDVLIAKLAETETLAAAIRVEFAFPTLSTLADLQIAATIARLLHESPGAPLAVLQSDAWNSPPPEANALVESGRQLTRQRERVAGRFTEDVLDQPHRDDIEFVEQKVSGSLSFLAFLNGRFRAIKRRWLGYRKSGYSPRLIDQANDLKQVDRYVGDRSTLEARAADARALFGNLWQGERSDWDALSSYVDWVVRVRAACVQHGLPPESVSLAAKPKPSIAPVLAAEESARVAAALLAQFCNSVEWSTTYFDGIPTCDVIVRLRAMRSSLASATQWAAFEQLRQAVSASPAADLLTYAFAADSAKVDFGKFSAMFRRAVLEQLLESMIGSRPVLREFRTATHEQRVAEFRELDERTLHENRGSVVTRLRESTQRRLQEPASRAGLPFLQREMAKQRNIAPLRRLLHNSEGTIRAIKPCFLMSPLTVAQYLGGKEPSFDLVIFDEASQQLAQSRAGDSWLWWAIRNNFHPRTSSPQRDKPARRWARTANPSSRIRRACSRNSWALASRLLDSSGTIEVRMNRSSASRMSHSTTPTCTRSRASKRIPILSACRSSTSRTAFTRAKDSISQRREGSSTLSSATRRNDRTNRLASVRSTCGSNWRFSTSSRCGAEKTPRSNHSFHVPLRSHSSSRIWRTFRGTSVTSSFSALRTVGRLTVAFDTTSAQSTVKMAGGG